MANGLRTPARGCHRHIDGGGHIRKRKLYEAVVSNADCARLAVHIGFENNLHSAVRRLLDPVFIHTSERLKCGVSQSVDPLGGRLAISAFS